MRKILFDIIVCSKFKLDPVTRVMWVADPESGESVVYDVSAEVEIEGDETNMKKAEDALRELVAKKYPGKKYQIYYWMWL